MKTVKIFILFLLISLSVKANDYKASLFGIKSDGITNNTGSIQKAIDYISEHGGGTLIFYVGRYLTGTVQLKSNVYIKLEEGAVLVGSQTPYDYFGTNDNRAIVEANGQTNVGVLGEGSDGVVEGAGDILVKNINNLLKAGYIKSSMAPGLIAFTNCANVSVSSLNLWYGPYSALTLINCRTVTVKGISIDGKGISSSGGIFLKNCQWVTVKDLFVKVNRKPMVSEDNQFLTIQKVMTDNGTSLSAHPM
ncbi:MAG: endopygalactorunase [Chitinophagaceae bacterium]|nr:MAG: endopygalactorunase [Chitinophagaceae bacterium]